MVLRVMVRYRTTLSAVEGNMTSLQALAALGPELQLRENNEPGDPAVRAELQDVIDALGLGPLDEQIPRDLATSRAFI